MFSQERAAGKASLPILHVARALRVHAVLEKLARLERNRVAGLDGDRLTGLRVLPRAGTAMALDKGAKADQRDAVLAMQGLGDFFQHCIKNAVGLLFG